ncbi:hypothetical protein EON65_28245 [archaeon]|nr:MAG: hypothetical protein EON65_28245 [archaeon]
MRAAVSEQSKLDLLARNEQLIKEIARLKKEYASLKRAFSALQIWKLSHLFAERVNQEVQTNLTGVVVKPADELNDSISTSQSSVVLPANYSYTTPAKQAEKHTPSSLSDSSPQSGSTVKKSPPSQERVTETLVYRIRMDTPLRSDAMDTPGRPSRHVRKPVSYAETPLSKKIRRGFKFFKFSDAI